MTPQLARIMRIAQIESERDQAAAVGVEHVMTAMAQEGANPGAAMFQKFGVTVEDVRALNFELKA